MVLVNGFNGLGLHTLLNINRIFTGVFKNFIFLQVGMIDSGVFKGGDQVEALKNRAHSEINRYVDYMRRNGFFAQGLVGLGTDVVHEIMKLSDEARKEYPQAIFFGGQIVFPRDTFITRFLHNYVVFAVQKQLYLNGIPFVIVPVRVNS